MDKKITKGNNSIKNEGRVTVTVLVVCILSDTLNIFMKFNEKNFNILRVTEPTPFSN